MGSFLHPYNYDTVPLKSYLVFRLWREAEEGEILVVLDTVVPTRRKYNYKKLIVEEQDFYYI